MKVIIDLHAVQSSQKGNDHSGTRDDSQEWGDRYIDKTVEVIHFLAENFASDPALAAIELLNEPLAPGVRLDDLIKYYKAGYDAVRKYNKNANVILSNRLGSSDVAKPTELLQFAQSLSNVVIDVHFYSVYDEKFGQMSPQQNIKYIYNQRRSDLSSLNTANGQPLTFVGEWVAEFKANDRYKPTTPDYQRFASAQMEVYEDATFGWVYWSYK